MKTLLILFTGCLLSCNFRTLKPGVYVTFIKNPDNGLHQVQSEGSIHFDVQYKPLDYVCLLQNNSKHISKDQLKKLKAEFDGLIYFNFSITGSIASEIYKVQTEDTAEFKQRVNYLSFHANKDFWLLSGVDTLKCVIYHVEKNYEITSRTDVVLAFEPINRKNENKIGLLQFYFRDNVFNTGLHEFEFSENALLSIPSLKTD